MDAKSSERSYRVKFSYMEIYNEVIRDMMGRNPSLPLELREDPSKGLVVAGLVEQMATCGQSVSRMILAGTRNRKLDESNKLSSRSHAVFQITIEQSDKCAGIESEVKVSRLCFIDLAGSERLSNTPKDSNITRSLLALGNCINRLAECKGKAVHVPYRDSKLTRLLKDSLGGNCETVMIGNVVGSLSAYEDTLNTLKYAAKARNIKTSVQKNVVNVHFHVSQYTQIIGQLKKEIMILKSRLTDNTKMEAPIDLPNNSSTLLNEINEHYKERAQLRKRLFLEKGKAAELTFLSNQQENDKLIKELHTNQDNLQRQLEEHKRSKLLFQDKAKQLPITTADIVLKQIAHEEDLVDKIPIEEKIKANKAKKYFSLQSAVIAKLKEQIRLRDDILESYAESKNALNLSRDDASDCYELAGERAGVEHKVSSPVLSKRGRKRLYRKRQRRSNSVLNASDEQSEINAKKLTPFLHSHAPSIASPYVSGNRGKLRAAGVQIIDVQPRLRIGRPYYYANLKEMKPSILAKPDKSVFEFLNKNKRCYKP
eukprot:TRINITY_DN8012_c0_g1_i13.p1 TRINITY_DN8012_c0_g1~~TRINITY_DN8012_c0_g1_i13.p1  ORF type:complete len:540 (-),score=104.39 TRINITY_DN8012_c0_g1_i13:114-1733(-)